MTRTTRENMKPTKTGPYRSPSDVCHTPRRSRKPTQHVCTRPSRTCGSIVLAGCFVAAMSSLSLADQTDPNGIKARRAPQSSATGTIGSRIAEAAATAPERSPGSAPLPHNDRVSQAPNQPRHTPGRFPSSAGLTQRLWESRVSAPDPNQDADAREELKDLIQKVRSLKFESNEVTPAFSSPIEPKPRAASTPAAPIAEAGPGMTAQRTPVTTPSAELSGSLRPATLEKLSGVLHDPANRVRDPLEMAELLFLSGHSIEAATFYERALALTASGDPAASEDRAWILFQLGNCLRETDMTRARDMYLKLVAEYPDSPWTELAAAHGRLITWYLTAKPQQLTSSGQSR
jgi:hypothetical protein